MTTRFLLDTNRMSQHIRDPRGIVGTRLREVGDSNISTSIDVAPLESGVDPHYRVPGLHIENWVRP